MAGFGIRDGRLHRLERTNLADQYHIRRLAHGVYQGAIKTLGVESHFPLSDNRLFMPVHELDRVFDREDVAGLARVSMVNHRRQCCRFARARGSYNQNQASF